MKYYKEYQRQYYLQNKERKLAYAKKYREENFEKVATVKKEWQERNKAQLSEKKKEHRQNNLKEIRSNERASYGRHKEKKIKRKVAYCRERRQVDPVFRMTNNLRKRLTDALAGRNKSAATLELLGCSVCDLKLHLESNFTEGMTWENYSFSGWHIDHIRPCASFDLSCPEQQKQCFHYTNLQPLWAEDNLRKGDTYVV